jgi:hypothetical protein
MSNSTDVVHLESFVKRIQIIRGQRVVLDSDLAELYGVSTKRFNEQVKRNEARFPADFMFQISKEEFDILRSQNATSKGSGGRRYLPHAFTEHGAIMAATILNSPRAVEMSVFVVRAFVRLREMLSTHKKLAAKLDELEQKLLSHDEDIALLIDAIKQLMEEPVAKKRPIGFI